MGYIRPMRVYIIIVWVYGAPVKEHTESLKIIAINSEYFTMVVS